MIHKDFRTIIWSISAILLVLFAVCIFCDDVPVGFASFTGLFVFILAGIYLWENKQINSVLSLAMFLVLIVYNPFFALQFQTDVLLVLVMLSALLFGYLAYADYRWLKPKIAKLCKKKATKRKSK